MEFNKRTIAERFSRLPQDKQGAFLEALQQQDIDFTQLPIVARAARGVFPSSYAQRRQWFLWRLDPDSSAYHITGALTLTGALSPAALRDSF
ncbi:hypothetical protein, partial [Modicisalibacter radicis]|uniref:hypothetical protein n=1 Tax=Halomonas sp. EAR18 TaxID=2518972 RepID=UPI0014441241